MNRVYLVLSVIGLLLVMGLSFYFGYKVGRGSGTVITKEIHYEVGKPVMGKIAELKPVKVTVPSVIIWDRPEIDSVKNEKGELDSLKIVNDWMSQRDYDISLFSNDSIGKMDIKATVQYNRLISMDYRFDPVTKVIKEKINPEFSIIGGIGGFNNGEVNFQVGLFRKSWGFSYLYKIDPFTKNSNHGVNLMYKFNF